MFYTEKEKRKLKNELKELFAELERNLKKDIAEESFYRTPYSRSYNENNQEINEIAYEMCKIINNITELQTNFEKLSRRVEKVERISFSGKGGDKTNTTTPQINEMEIMRANSISTNEAFSDDSFCTKFNNYINTGSMHSDFKSINLS